MLGYGKLRWTELPSNEARKCPQAFKTSYSQGIESIDQSWIRGQEYVCTPNPRPAAEIFEFAEVAAQPFSAKLDSPPPAIRVYDLLFLFENNEVM